MSETTPFWEEVSEAFLLRNPDWAAVIEQMPERIDAEEVLKRVQSADQLAEACVSGTGYVRGDLVVKQPDKRTMRGNLRREPNPENLWFQLFYQFCIAEGVCKTFSDKPLAQWPAPFLCLLEEIFQFFVYLSALLYLADSGFLPEHGGDDWLRLMEPDVKNALRSIIGVLCSKGCDYGQSYRRHGLPGLLPRIWDKMARYMQLKSTPTVNHESRSDSARDLLGYSIIGWSLLLELEGVELGDPVPEKETP